MSAGVRKNIKYLSMVQVKAVLFILGFIIAYGVFFSLISDSDMYEMAYTMAKMAMTLGVLSIEMRFVKGTANFIVSLGAVRKDIIKAHHVMNLELLAEVLLICAGANFVIGNEVDFILTTYWDLVVAIIMMTAGMGVALLVDKWQKWGVVIGIVIGAGAGMCSVNGLKIANTLSAKGTDGFFRYLKIVNYPLGQVGALLVAVIAYSFISAFVAKKINKMEVIV